MAGKQLYWVVNPSLEQLVCMTAVTRMMSEYIVKVLFPVVVQVDVKCVRICSCQAITMKHFSEKLEFTQDGCRVLINLIIYI